MKRNWRAIGSVVTLMAAVAVASAAWAQAQQKTDTQQKKGEASQKTQPQQKTESDPKKKTVAKAPPGKLEKLMCMRGTEDEHARIAVEVIGGRVQSFAYYSKKKPRTCSVHVQREDAYSRWSDEGRFSKVTTENGDFLIENRPKDVKFMFRDVDRMHYCGMNIGKINGTLTVTRGKRECTVEQLMEAHQEEAEPARDAASQEKAEQKPAPRS